jgi:diadenosine tetraphosphate (Ap4A) HIT family hydrolase
MARLPEGFAVIGDVQWLPGYCVLLADDPAITRLTDLPRSRRLDYLASMERLAEAVEQSCSELDTAFRRVNVEILGNADPFLHAHVWPRYEWEPDHLVTKPVWSYPPENWTDPALRYGPQHEELRVAITRRLAVTLPD